MTTIQVTQQQRDNAIDARDVMWPSVPPENVVRGLEFWRKGHHLRRSSPPTCGTIACFGGWSAWWPAFQAQGVSGQFDGSPGTLIGAGWCGPHMTSEKLFGVRRMFNTRSSHPADKSFPKGGTDHELVTHRLNWLIDNSEVVG